MKSNEIIDPITEQQQRQVIAATHRCIDQASALYGREFKTVPVDFDLSGRCAGMYQVRGRARRIRFNPLVIRQILSRQYWRHGDS